jgi:hypothetical protein
MLEKNGKGKEVLTMPTDHHTPQQESWQDRLVKWVETQHGTAGWELKLENFISSERQRLLNEVKRVVIGDDEPVQGIYLGDERLVQLMTIDL